MSSVEDVALVLSKREAELDASLRWADRRRRLSKDAFCRRDFDAEYHETRYRLEELRMCIDLVEQLLHPIPF